MVGSIISEDLYIVDRDVLQRLYGDDDDYDVYYARGPPTQRALLLIYYIVNSDRCP